MAAARPIRIGRYVLFGELASGGMASVHWGRLIGTGGFAKTVAIKRLHRQFARDPKFRDSILEEGLLAARIRHPNVVAPLDVLSEGGELLLAMEYVHGESLSKLVRAARSAGERVPVAIGAAVLSNVLHGLHAAHEAKDEKGRPLDIVHRDVSPQNVLVGTDGVSRVIDFGIAKAVTSRLESTSTGVIKGKVPYLAPEQLEGDPATRRTDVYAATVVLWEVLAGRRLFEGEDDGEILRKILGMNVPPPSAFNAEVPAAVDEVVLRGIARAPAHRYATAREMALALEGVAHLATASIVGEWCERLAAEALAKRAAELAEVEASEKRISSRPPPPPTPPPVSRPAPASVRPPPPAPAPPRSRPFVSPSASFAGVDPAVTYASQTVSAPVAQLAELPDSQRGPIASGGPSPTGATAAVSAFGPTVMIDDRPRLPPAGALRKPALEIPNVEWLPTAPAPKPESVGKRAAKVAGVLLVLAIVVAFACLPLIVKSVIVSGAADRGVALTVDRVEVSRRSLRLVDVRAAAQDLPGATAHATAVEIGLSHFVPTRIAIADVDVALEGNRPELVSRIDRWRGAHEKSLSEWVSDVEEVSIASGRIDWRGAMGAQSKVVIENVSFEGKGGRGRPLVSEYHLTAPLVTLSAGGVTAGPWKLDVDRRGVITRSELRLDPSGTFAAAVSWATADDGSTTVEFAVPRVGLADVHLPPAILGGGAIAATRIEMRGKIEVAAAKAPSRTIQGRLFIGASSVAVFPNASPVDVAVDLPIAGDATKPVRVDRAVVAVTSTDPSMKRTTQHATAYLAGTIDDTGTKLSVDLAGKSTSVPCTPKGETQLDARLDFGLDVAATRLSLVPWPACTPRFR